MDQFLATVQIGVTVMGTLAGVLGGVPGQPLPRARSRRTGARPLACRRPSWPASSSASRIVYVELILGELVPKALALRFTGDGRAPRVLAPQRHGPGLALGRGRSSPPPPAAVLRALRHPGRRAPHLRVGGGDQAPGQGGPAAGRPRPDRDGADPQRLRVHGDAGAARSWCRGPRSSRLDVDTPPDEVGALIVESGFSRIPVYDGSHRQRGRPRLREGRPAAPGEAPAGRAPQDPAPRALRARDQEGGRPAQGAAEAAHPHGRS